MLKKLYRITKTKEFEKFFGKDFKKAGCYSANSSHFIIKSLRNELKSSRFAFIISGKIAKKAVQRNLIKRRLREIIRFRLGKIDSGYDVLIIAKKGVLPLTFQDIETEVETLLKKLRLIKNG